MSAFEGMGLKRSLPEGTKHSNINGIEMFDIPAQTLQDNNEFSLIPVSVLPQWAQLAFPNVTKFNLVQSVVFQAAFEKSDNLLVSAPTGKRFLSTGKKLQN